MASGLLSLKWNNHRSTFFHVLSTIRSKESYCDVTLACDGRFYSLHKFVLSTCSEYFEEMFERTQCKHPVIVLKDIKYDDLEALLNYMYVGEVNVVQEKLAGLIKAAECLKIKGLAVPDEDPMESKENSLSREQNKRSQRSDDSPRPKRRRRENSSDVGEEILSPIRSRPSGRIRDHPSSNSSQAAKTNTISSEDNRHNEGREEDPHDDTHEEAENSSINANRQIDSNANRSNSSSHKKEHMPEEVTLDDDGVKSEPVDMENEVGPSSEEHQDNKDSLHQELGFDASDSMGADDDNYVDVDPSMLGGQPQSVEDVVAQAMPGSSGFQGNSFPMWEGEGSLSNFPVEGFSGDNSQARQMVNTGVDQQTSGSFLEHLQDLSSQVIYSDVTGLSRCLAAIPSSTATQNNKSHDNTSSGAEQLTIFPAGRDTCLPHALTKGKGCFAEKQCSVCPYNTRNPSNMLRHLRSHSQDKPFACPYCSYRTKQNPHLKRHLATHSRPHQSMHSQNLLSTSLLINEDVSRLFNVTDDVISTSK